MIGWCCPLAFPEVRCSYLWHPYGLCLTQHSAFLAVVHSSLKPKNDSEAARIPQWQQAMSEELPVLQKTSFITLSDRGGLKPLPDGNTTIEGNSDSLLVSILRRLLPRRQGLLLYGLWLQLLPRWESSLCSGNAFQKGKLRLKTNADPTDVIVPVPALQKQATDSLHRCDRRDNRTWLAPFRQIEITLIYWIRETFQFPDDLKIRY